MSTVHRVRAPSPTPGHSCIREGNPIRPQGPDVPGIGDRGSRCRIPVGRTRRPFALRPRHVASLASPASLASLAAGPRPFPPRQPFADVPSPPPSSHACDARRAPWAPPATPDGTNRSPPSPSMVRASFCVAAAPHRLQAKPLHVLTFDWRPRGGRPALLPILSKEERRLLPPRPGRWSPLGFEERRRRVGG